MYQTAVYTLVTHQKQQISQKVIAQQYIN